MYKSRYKYHLLNTICERVFIKTRSQYYEYVKIRKISI